MERPKVGVVGVGYVGKHLVDTFANAYDVIGYDVLKTRIEFLQKEYQNNNILFTTSPEQLCSCDMICIAVPTLLNPDNSINDTYLKNAVTTLKNVVKGGCTLVMESSVHVGMTRMLLGEFVNQGVYVGFSPERVDPGRVKPAYIDIPKIVSGINDESLEKIKGYYSKCFAHIVPVSTLETAEMCKLYENCYRMVNIAYANEAADACEKLNIDPVEMINACKTKPFGFSPFYPGLGVGGYCIPVNPFYLAVNCDIPLLRHATDVMCSRPSQKAVEFIKAFPSCNSIIVIGIAFKPGETLTVNSPAYMFAMDLRNIHQKIVYTCDPFVDAMDQYHITVDEVTGKIKQRQIDIVCIALKQSNIDFTIVEELCNEHGVILKRYV